MANNRLYPPIIDSKIPAFYKQKGEAEDGSQDVAILRVPYNMNASVSYGDIGGFYIKIKTIGNNKEIIHMPSTTYFEAQGYVNFELTGEVLGALAEGNFYKIQLAYYAETEKGNEYLVGHYSDVATVKYTALGKVYLSGDEEGLLQSQVLFNLDNIIGIYYHPDDITEKAYSYQFIIKKLNGEAYYDSGELLHNTETDVDKEQSSDKLSSWLALSEEETYNLQYKVTTVNGIELVSPVYKMAARSSLIENGLDKCKLVATNNYDDAYIALTLDKAGYLESDLDFYMLGTYQILKSSSKDDFSSWYIVNSFTLSGIKPRDFIWKDLLIEQGVTYKYAIQQKNNYGVCSKRLYSEEIYAAFESAFLIGADGRQLKLCFNSKISGLKKNLLENKVDTIGNRYPFIFRNGRVNYKTFTIGGLLSYHMDDQEMFITMEEIGVDNEKGGIRGYSGEGTAEKTVYTNGANDKKLHVPTTHQTTENIVSEHLFREAAWEWLNNGDKKVYKSPTEGNTIIHLMNISLTPNSQLSNMIAEFSTTAYEIGEYNIDTLVDFGFLKQSADVYNYLKSGCISEIGFKNWTQEDNDEYVLNLVGDDGQLTKNVETFEITVDYIRNQNDNNSAANLLFYLEIGTTTQDMSTTKIYFRGEQHLVYSAKNDDYNFGYAVGDLQGSFHTIKLHCVDSSVIEDLKVVFNTLYYDKEKNQFDYVSNVALFDYPLSEIRGYNSKGLGANDSGAYPIVEGNNIIGMFNNNFVKIDRVKKVRLKPKYKYEYYTVDSEYTPATSGFEEKILNNMDLQNPSTMYILQTKEGNTPFAYYHYGRDEDYYDTSNQEYQYYDYSKYNQLEADSYQINGNSVGYLVGENADYEVTENAFGNAITSLKVGANIVPQLDMTVVMHYYDNLDEKSQIAKKNFEDCLKSYQLILEDKEANWFDCFKKKKELMNAAEAYSDALGDMWEVIE